MRLACSGGSRYIYKSPCKSEVDTLNDRSSTLKGCRRLATRHECYKHQQRSSLRAFFRSIPRVAIQTTEENIRLSSSALSPPVPIHQQLVTSSLDTQVTAHPSMAPRFIQVPTPEPIPGPSHKERTGLQKEYYLSTCRVRG